MFLLLTSKSEDGTSSGAREELHVSLVSSESTVEKTAGLELPDAKDEDSVAFLTDGDGEERSAVLRASRALS